MHILKNFGRVVYNFLPQACLICGDKILSDLALCNPCKAELPWLLHACQYCALPLPMELSVTICGQCIDELPVFNRTIALFHYQPPINKLINNLKFGNKLICSKIFGRLMLERLNFIYDEYGWPECVIPVPLHKQRLRERGYNQVLELARFIVCTIKRPLIIHGVKRIRATAPQTSLSGAQRLKNLKRAFQVKSPFAFKHVAIIDDVMTTGSTVREFAKILKAAGVQKIDVWCVARVDY